MKPFMGLVVVLVYGPVFFALAMKDVWDWRDVVVFVLFMVSFVKVACLWKELD